MSVIITIGIAIIMLGIGLFVGKLLTSNSTINNNDGKQSLFQQWKANRAAKKAAKRKEAEVRKAMQAKAREQALLEMQPELVAHMKQQEMDKLTGVDKKKKLEKFVNAFSMSGSGFNSEQKLNSMLGGNQNQEYPSNQSYGYNHPGPTTSQVPPQQEYSRTAHRGRTPKQEPAQQHHPVQQQQNNPFSSDKLGMMLGGNNNQNTNMNFDSGNTFSQNKIDMMLGKNNNKQKPKNQEEEMSTEEKIKRMLG